MRSGRWDGCKCVDGDSLRALVYPSYCSGVLSVLMVSTCYPDRTYFPYCKKDIPGLSYQWCTVLLQVAGAFVYLLCSGSAAACLT